MRILKPLPRSWPPKKHPLSRKCSFCAPSLKHPFSTLSFSFNGLAPFLNPNSHTHNYSTKPSVPAESAFSSSVTVRTSLICQQIYHLLVLSCNQNLNVTNTTYRTVWAT